MRKRQTQRVRDVRPYAGPEVVAHVNLDQLRRETSDTRDAQDALHDAAVAVLEACQQYHLPNTIEYLRAVARNAIRHHVKADRRQLRRLPADEDADLRIVAPFDLERTTEVRHLFGRLDPVDRAVV